MIEIEDISDGRGPLDDDQIRILRQIELNSLTKGTPDQYSLGWKERAWEIIDQCDLALMGNEEARQRLTRSVRGNQRYGLWPPPN